MAQASGQSAQIVSEQLTSVWNNFAKGGENLEHFADVMVRLGADTASSSDEIAEGLQKFASVGETIGLSYDNAAAALATITDRTRESADTVGTALKTIFSRLQGLKLGDTLEDGTNLNKYSEALQAVGVYIKDGNGNLRDMDILLEELGEKWKTLERDEKTALAQTVAGTRQYATFEALMNNYDFYQQNLDRARNSEGSLEEQANIYADSWEAARDRVQAALEDIYTKLINDEFFIDMSNGFEKILEGVSGFIDGLGGVKGMLLLISSIFMRNFADKMPQVLTSLKENLLIAFGQGPKLMAQMQQENQKSLKQFQSRTDVTQAQKIEAEGLFKISRLQQEYVQKSKYMTQADKELYQQRLKNIQSLYDYRTALQKKNEEADEETNKAVIRAANQRHDTTYRQASQEERDARIKMLEGQLAAGKILNSQGNSNMSEEEKNQIQTQIDSLTAGEAYTIPVTINISTQEAKQRLKEFVRQVELQYQALAGQESVSKNVQGWAEAAKNLTGNKKEIDNLKNTIRQYLKYIREVGPALSESFDTDPIDKFETLLDDSGDDIAGLIKGIEKYGEVIENQFEEMVSSALSEAERLEHELKQDGMRTDNVRRAAQESGEIKGKIQETDVKSNIPETLPKPSPLPGSQVIMEVSSALMGLQSVFTSVTSAMQVFNDETSTMSDKVGANISIITSLGFAVNGVASAFTAFKSSALVASIGLGPAFLAVAAAIAAIAAIITIVVRKFKEWKANTPEGQLQSTKKAAAELNAELEKTNNKLSEVKNSFNSLQSAKDKIAECKKGTEEWNEALKNNNDEVRKLIEQYPELLSKTQINKNGEIESAISVDQNGIMTIADWAQEWVVDTINLSANKVQMASDLQQDVVGKKEENVVLSKINEQTNKLTTTLSASNVEDFTKKFRQVINSDATDNYIQSIYKMHRDDDGNITLNNVVPQDSYRLEYVNSVKQLINQYGQDAADHLKESDLFADEIEQNYEAISKLIELELEYRELQKKNEEATLLRNEATAAQLMQDNEQYKQNSYKSNINQIVATNGLNPAAFSVTDENFLGPEKTKFFASKFDLRDEYKEDVSTSAGVDLVKRYLEETLKVDNYDDLQYNKKQSQWTYKVEGEEEVQTALPDTIAAALASEKVQASAKKYGETIAEAMSEFTSQEQADLFTAGVTGNASLLDNKLLAKSNAEIKKLIDSMQLTDELAKKIGYSSAQSFKETIETIVDMRKAFNTFTQDYQKNIAKIIAGDEDAVAAAKTMASQLQEALHFDSKLDDIITPEFVKNNQALFDEFVAGVEDAAVNLRKIIGEEIWIRAGLDATDFNTTWNELNLLIQEAYGIGLTELEFGASLDDTQVLGSLENIMNNLIGMGYTAEEAGKMLVDSLGISVDTEETNEKIETPQTYVNAIPEPASANAWSTHPVIGLPVPVAFTGVRWRLEQAQSISEANSAATAVKVKNAKYVGGGKINRTKKNTITSPKAAPPGAPSSSGGSKGSGGGSTETKKKPAKRGVHETTERKNRQEEIERYHEITETLEDLGDCLEKIADLKEEAFGVDKLALMDQEKKKLQELVVSQKQYQKEIAKNLSIDKAKAQSNGLMIDETTGRVINYEEAMNAILNKHDAAMAAYDTEANRILDMQYQLDKMNETEGNDEEKWALEDQIDAATTANDKNKEVADKNYEEAKKSFEQYEETLNLSEQAELKLEDYLRQIRQLNYEKLEYKLEIRVELNESDLKDVEHQLSRLSENDYTRSAERIALISSEAQTYKLMADDWKRFIEDLKAQYAAEKINQKEFIEGLKKASDAISETETNMREGIVAIGDELRNAFSDATYELDAVYERMQRRLDFADFYKDISTIINGKPDYNLLNSMLDSQTSMLNTRIDGRTNERDALIRKQQELYTEMNNTTSEEEKAQIRETLDQVESRIADLNSEIQSDIQTLAEYAQTKFENTIEEIADTWQEQNFGESLLAVLEDIDLRNRAQEELLTKTNQIYETNKLIRQAEKDIAATTNKRAKQAYEEYINKAKQKQEQKELTRLELDLLTAEYEITKAQIALEEAKDAKDTVRLTRDSEGNFGYVYTANQDKISNAQQALDDATNNYYNIALEGAKSSSEQIYQLQEEWLEEVKKINLDAKLDEEQKQAKIAEITEKYNTMISQQREKYYIAKAAVEDSSYEHELDYNLKSINDAEKWFETKDAVIKNMTGAEQTYQTDIENVSDKVKQAYGNQENAINYVKTATELYGKDLDTLIPQIETDLTKAIDTATGAWKRQIEQLEKMIELVNQVKKDTHDTLLQETYKDNYAAQISNALKAEAEYGDYDIQKLLEYRWDKLGGVDNTDYQALIDAGGTEEQIALWKVLRRYKMERMDWSAFIQEHPEFEWAADVRLEKLTVNDYSQLIMDYMKSVYARWSDSIVQRYLAERLVKMQENPETYGKYMSNDELKAKIAASKGVSVEKLKTGGYTGEWGPEGRMAILHEKELVLNADDTKNILTSVGIIREISKALDNNALWSTLGMANLNASYIATGVRDTLQQEVTIHADFPNVQEHNEIELAIENLINAASQYAHRN